MHELLDIDQIKPRAAALGLSMWTLAKLAGLSGWTGHRAGKSNHTRNTLRKLTDKLVELETRQFTHLQGLYDRRRGAA